MIDPAQSMNDSYPERVQEVLLPLSQADTLYTAFSEWQFSGSMIDHEEAIETCQLCGKDRLRYHFEISNALTESALWVGSRCILRFSIAVIEDGRALGACQAKVKLNSLIADARHTLCLQSLERLANDESSEILTNALKFYNRTGYLTPKFAFVVFWRLGRNNIDHIRSLFKISLQRDKYRTDLSNMETSRVHMIWPALSLSQREIAERLGHRAP